MVCNGNLASKRVHGSRTTWVYHAPEPMAAYLATVQVGCYRLLDTSMQLFGPYPFESCTV